MSAIETPINAAAFRSTFGFTYEEVMASLTSAELACASNPSLDRNRLNWIRSDLVGLSYGEKNTVEQHIAQDGVNYLLKISFLPPIPRG